MYRARSYSIALVARSPVFGLKLDTVSRRRSICKYHRWRPVRGVGKAVWPIVCGSTSGLRSWPLCQAPLVSPVTFWTPGIVFRTTSCGAFAGWFKQMESLFCVSFYKAFPFLGSRATWNGIRTVADGLILLVWEPDPTLSPMRRA